ncbi:MAG: hypothetical protein EXR47_04290 [Dehalococcoidia bacterium]|nr:hypothetical protein [Dehalococcoidia bacterium]
MAHAFAERGTQPVFVSKQFDSRVQQRVLDAGFAYHPMPPGLGLEEDATGLIGLARDRAARLVVVDLSNTVVTTQATAYADYLRRVARDCDTVIIDDLTRTVFPAALVVNPNPGVHEAEYDLTHRPTFLLGPAYAMLHPTFRDAAKGRPRPEGPIKMAAVALGGGALGFDALHRVLIGLRQGLRPDVGVNVVAGADSETAAQFADDLASFTGPCAVLSDLPNLGDLFRKADLAIVSGGVTKFESAASGAATVMLAQVEHQEAWAKVFENTGAALYAGPAAAVTPSSIAEVARALSQDAGFRQRLVKRATTLVDGWGASRVVSKALSSLGRTSGADAPPHGATQA